MLSMKKLTLHAASITACLAAAFLWTSPALAQEVGESFFDTVEVDLVNLEVFVTDRDGRPVTGLTAADFEVYRDGEPVDITNFYAAEATTRSAETAAALGADEDAAAAEATTDEASRLNLVVFIDNQNIAPRNRNRVIDALRGSLFFNLRDEDRVTLMSYDGSLNIRQGLTRDPRDLAAALDEIAQGGATGAFSGLDRLSILRELQQTDLDRDAATFAGPGLGPGQFEQDWNSILQRIRTYAQSEFGRTVATVETLGSLVDSLSGLEGRKALLYVSDGLSLRPGEALIQAFARKAPPGLINADLEGRDYDATQTFERLGKRANASRVTFYTMLAAGAGSQGPSLAERTAFFDEAADAADLGQVWDQGFETLERSNFRASMQILAQSTGGLATLSSRDFTGAMRRVQQDLGTFYSLGFEAPEDESNDHRVKVAVRRDGLKVRHRESFRQRSTEEQMKVRTQSALIFKDTKNPLGVVAEFGPPRKADKGRGYLVPVIVKFPLGKLVLAPGERTHDGRVSIYVGARAAGSGNLSPVQRLPAPVTIPNDQLMTALGQVAGYRMMLNMRDGEHSVAVSVRDEIAQIESTTVVRFDASAAVADLTANAGAGTQESGAAAAAP
ncbi:MAG: VWA domain-containing protein, partial [Acidobacteriota bacterium]